MTSWSGVAEAYRGSFATLCEGTVERVLDAVPEGPVVDVGCGSGSVMAAAARRRRGVVGLDPDPEMVAMARTLGHGPVIRAGVPRLPLADASVTALCANFVVNHVPDPRASCRELARVLAPGGRVALTIWPAVRPAWGELVGAAFDIAGVDLRPGTRLAPELDFERSADGLAGIVSAGGLTPLEADEVHWTWRVRPEALWAGIAGGVTGMGQTYLGLPPSSREAVTQAYRGLAHERSRRGWLELASAAALVVASR